MSVHKRSRSRLRLFGLLTATVMALGTAASVQAREGAAPPDVAATGLPAVTPLQYYESSIGTPPSTYTPSGHLGYTWVGESPGAVAEPTYSRGELIVDAVPYNDTGAASNEDTTTPLSNAESDATLPGVCLESGGSTTAADPSHYGGWVYPSATDLENSADLVEVRIARSGADYHIAFVLQTMAEGETDPPVVALGLTGRGERPRAASGLAAFDHLLQVTPTSATFDGQTVPSYTDIPGHTIEAEFPVSSAPSGPWQAAAVAGVWHNGAWAAVTNLAYDPGEPTEGTPNCWYDRAQSQYIASGRYPTFPVNLETGPAPAIRPGAASVERGVVIRTYFPPIHIGEGITSLQRYDNTFYRLYRGLVNPYSVYVPPSYNPDRPAPVIMLLHCLACTEDVYDWSAWPGIKQLADRRGALVVTPLAYSEAGMYEGEAEWDVIGVLSDVTRRYRVDRSRLYLAGMSMGTLGEFRIGLLYPQLWAATFGVGNYTEPGDCEQVIAYPAECYWASYDYYDLLPNAQNIPWGLLNGAADELTPVTLATQVSVQLSQLGYPYRLWLYPERDHDPALVGTTADVTSAWLGNLQVLTHPSHVTYAYYPAVDTAAAPATDGPQTWVIPHNVAYWLSGMAVVSGVTSGEVQAVSGRGQSYAVTSDSGNGSDAAGPYLWRGNDPRLVTTDGPNALNLTLTDMSAVTVDPAGALLCPRQPLTMTVTSNSPATVSMTGVGTWTVPSGTSVVHIDDQSWTGSCLSSSP